MPPPDWNKPINALRKKLRKVRNWLDARREGLSTRLGRQGISEPKGAQPTIATKPAPLIAQEIKGKPGEPKHRKTRPGRPDIAVSRLDRQAASVVRRLQRSGYKAYLVGGCVRDLLFDLPPKDFDIATNARPEEIRKLFRNSRIVGRRFRLIHLFFHGGKIIEVATFRAQAIQDSENQEEGDLLIRRDNVFGTEQEDALRRDFTINGLFYDVVQGRIIDYVKGRQDIDTRILRMIGDPNIRLQEDPVRILRAIRFVAKADLKIEDSLRQAIERHRDGIVRCAPARILEETLKLLRSGYAEHTVREMEATGVLELLLPEVQAFLNAPEPEIEMLAEKRGSRPKSDSVAEPISKRLSPRDALFRHLECLDMYIQYEPVEDCVVLAALLYAPLAAEPARKPPTDEEEEAEPDLFDTVSTRLNLTKRLKAQLEQIFTLQRQFGPTALPIGKRRRRISPKVLRQRVIFPDALAVYQIHIEAMSGPRAIAERWLEDD